MHYCLFKIYYIYFNFCLFIAHSVVLMLCVVLQSFTCMVVHKDRTWTLFLHWIFTIKIRCTAEVGVNSVWRQSTIQKRNIWFTNSVSDASTCTTRRQVHDMHTMTITCMQDGTSVNFERKFFSNVIYVCSHTHFLGCMDPKICTEPTKKDTLNAPCVFLGI